MPISLNPIKTQKSTVVSKKTNIRRSSAAHRQTLGFDSDLDTKRETAGINQNTDPGDVLKRANTIDLTKNVEALKGMEMTEEKQNANFLGCLK